LGGFWLVGRIDVSAIRHGPHWLGCFPLGSLFLKWQGYGSFLAAGCKERRVGAISDKIRTDCATDCRYLGGRAPPAKSV
jgi:hypothetical protein